GAERYGCEFSPISLFLKNQLRLEWVRVRAAQNIGLLLSGRGECFTRWKGSLRKLQKKHFDWRSTSCLLRLGLSLEMI
ncbi:uncharacterized protein METZ01_LOCUS92267, partial [marine metagenome]